MRMKGERSKKLAGIIGLCTCILSLNCSTALAQEPRFLNRVQVIGGSATRCPAVFLSFKTPLKPVSNFSSNDGKTFSIRMTGEFEPIAGDDLSELIESHPQMEVPGLGNITIQLDASSATPVLSLRFHQSVTPQVNQSGDNSIVVSGLVPTGTTSCGVPVVGTPPQGSPVIPNLDTTVLSLPDRPSPGDIATETVDGETNEVELMFAMARLAVTEKNYRRAAQILTKLTEIPKHPRSADAQELLGVVRERNGQLAHAKAEYEIYLKKYPKNSGAKRVRQRLAAILTAEAAPPEKLREAGTGYNGPKDARNPASSISSIPRDSDLDREGFETEDGYNKPTYSATVSANYYYNQGSTRFTEFEIGTVDIDDEVFQNSFVTALDAQGSFETYGAKVSWRIAGDYEQDFINSDGSKFRFSRVYADIESKKTGIALRVGRQTRYDGGVFGRFDGAMITIPLNEIISMRAIAGLYADSTADGLFESDQTLYGTSLHVSDIIKDVDASIYFINQESGDFTDRQAIGFDVQYLTPNTSILALLDYDLVFKRVTTARISGTRIFADQSSLTLSADLTHSPYLTLTNALLGQTATTLEELRATFSLGEIEQLALDRTTMTESFTAAYSKPLNDAWRFSIDGSVFHTSGSPASGGVPAIPSPGVEFYSSAQFIGTGIFSEDDVVSAAMRYANTARSDLFQVDLYRRFRYSEKLRLKPRITFGARKFTSARGNELFAIPSITATYRVNNTTSLEAEVGGRLSSLRAPAFREERNEVFVFVGFVKEF